MGKGLLAALMLCSAPARAEIFITHGWLREDVAGDALEKADLELGSQLLLRGVERRESEGRSVLSLPSSGQVAHGLPDFRVLSGALEEKLKRLFAEREYLEEYFPPEDIYFSVGEPRPTGKAGRAADMEVVFGGELLVVFGVFRHGSGLSVIYPERVLSATRRERLFDIPNPGLRRRVEQAILDRCRQMFK